MFILSGQAHTAASYTKQGYGAHPSCLVGHLKTFWAQPPKAPLPPLQLTQLFTITATIKFQPVFCWCLLGPCLLGEDIAALPNPTQV